MGFQHLSIISLMLKCVVQPPVKRAPGWTVQAKLDVFLWLGTCGESSRILDNLPSGFELVSTSFEDRTGVPPEYLLYTGKTIQLTFLKIELIRCFAHLALKVYIILGSSFLKPLLVTFSTI